jgi:signal transduction histidine kinase
MNRDGALLVVLTAAVAAIGAILIFAVLRFLGATRGAQRRPRESGSETALLSSALQEAVAKLKAQEQQMAARARESEALSEHILDSLTAGLLVVEMDGRVEILNPAGYRLLDVAPGALGRDYREVLAGCAPLRDLITECLATGAVAPAREIAVQGSDGQMFLSLSVSSLAAGGDREGIVCLLSDVTPLRELEEQLRLKDALARLGELTAGIAHEFRNGLATIHGYSRLLRPDALPESYRPYVDGIRQESESLGHVMTNFLKFARPEPAAFAAVDLEAIARRAVDDLAHELPAQTDVLVEGTFAPVDGDEVLLRQVFANLVRNAAEACAAAQVPPTVRVRGTADDRVCRVSVDDNGPGIPEHARTRVFEPFFTTRSRGTGLGLAIVQKVVVNHNGRVSAARSPLGGASIHLVFPLSGARTSVAH